MSKQLRKKPSKIGAEKGARARRRTPKEIVSAVPRQSGDLGSEDPKFAEVLALIETARNRAYQAINSELVTLYWQLGEHISQTGTGVSSKQVSASATRRGAVGDDRRLSAGF